MKTNKKTSLKSKTKSKSKNSNKQKKQEKLKVLAIGDLHGDSDLAKKLAEKAQKNNVDLVMLLGDIHGFVESRNLVKPFQKAHKQVVFVPGNWDSTLDAKQLSEIYNVKNLDGYYATYKDVGIIGVGSPDFQLELNEKKTFEKLEKNFMKLKKLEKKNPSLKKKILISHIHAAKTKSEFSGFPGSSALRKAIDKFQPDFFLSAHIHEAEGIEEKIGKTRVINVGRRGKIFEV